MNNPIIHHNQRKPNDDIPTYEEMAHHCSFCSDYHGILIEIIPGTLVCSTCLHGFINKINTAILERCTNGF